MTIDPFEVLGVPETAVDADIKAAYRGLVKAHHPDVDRSEGAIGRFHEIQAAYELLLDPSKKAAAIRARQRKSGGSSSSSAPANLAAEFGSFFDNIDKHGRGRPIHAHASAGATRRQEPVQKELSITLEQAFAGGEFEVPGASGQCDKCAGAGTVATEDWRSCEVCSGHGFTRVVRGILTVEAECPACAGRGKTRTTSCPSCAGLGRVSHRAATVTVPPGCKDGYRIAQTSTPGVRGWSGAPDLTVTVRVEDHDRFERVEEHLRTLVQVPVWMAALGGRLDIAGVDGARVSVQVSPGLPSGHQLRIPGHGMPAFSGRGDLLVDLNVAVPDATEEATLRAAFEQVRDAMQQAAR